MKTFKISLFITLVSMVILGSAGLLLDRAFPKKVYQAERIESILIKSVDENPSEDEYYVHFADWIHQGNINAKPGDIVLVIEHKSRITDVIFHREIYSDFKLKR